MRNYKRAISIVFCIALLCGTMFAFTGCGKASKIKKESADLGQWQDTKMVSESDGKAHDVKMRVTEIITDEATVQSEIDAYNVSGTTNRIGELADTDKQYCIVKYEVKFPSNFPQGVYGITQCVPDMKVVGLDGGYVNIDNIDYKGLGGIIEIGNVSQGYDFYAGETYSGKGVYAMVKGTTAYYIMQKYKDTVDGKEKTVKKYFKVTK